MVTQMNRWESSPEASMQGWICVDLLADLEDDDLEPDDRDLLGALGVVLNHRRKPVVRKEFTGT